LRIRTKLEQKIMQEKRESARYVSQTGFLLPFSHCTSILGNVR
jgi:hypothetical protein